MRGDETERRQTMTTRLLRHGTQLAFTAAVLVSCTQDATTPDLTTPDLSVQVVGSAPAASTLMWQEQSRTLVATNRLSALAAGRVYAAVSVAQHRAIGDVDKTGGRAGYEAERGSVTGASARVLGFLFPAAAATLDQMVADQGIEGPGAVHPHFTSGLAIGRAAGDAMVEHLKNDKFTAPWTGTVPVGPGLWIPSSLPPGGGTLSGVTPYFLTSASQFRSAPPPAFGSAAFNADLSEVLTLAQNRSAAELALALYWDAPAGTPTPVGIWNNTAAGYVTQRGMDERAATEVFAVLQAAMFDALIGCWEAKYHYWLLRPSHANPAIPLAHALPNFPAYPSGHACASAAAGRVLTHFFPEHTIQLATLVSDAGLARILAGIHYRFDMTAGVQLGKQVAEWAIPRGAP
jgi:membrane-associated phospholipid phosphatase